jgi:hypothetical protein
MLFSKNDRWNFGYLHTAMMTLVRIVTLSNWGDVMYKQIYGCDAYTNGSEAEWSTCDTPVR